MTAFQSLLDAHTTYYLPAGYGSVFFATPFAIKSRVIGGQQKFFTSQPNYPYFLWAKVCGTGCAYTEAMQGWEISKLNDVAVPTFIKSFSRGGGTYYDNGVRANAFLSGTLFGQSNLMMSNMPDATFKVTLINPSSGQEVPMTLPYAFGGLMADWSRASMIANNAHPSLTKRSHELFAERQLLDTLQAHAGELRKRGADSSADLQQVEAAITELSLNLERIRVDTLLTRATLRRDGVAALEEGRLPFIPSPRQRMEDVMRLQAALWNQKPNAETLASKFESHEAPKQRSASSTSAAVEASVIAGDASQWKLYTATSPSDPNSFEALPAYYASYRDTSILRLNSFLTTGGYWIQSVNNVISRRTANNLNDNLIIDVTNNGGGSVCLNYATLAYLVNAWTDLSRVYGDDIVYSEYDLRMSPVLAGLNGANYLVYPDAFDVSTGANLGKTYYNNPTTRTIGSKSSSYTRGFNWNPCGNSNLYFTSPTNYHFDKIMVLTDGRCGSSCAYFVSQLRENNKVRVVSYGGIYGEPLATSSFAGGNVLSWDYITDTLPSYPQNPFSAYIAFNLRANYSPGKYPGTPRQFDRLEADWYLPIWDSLYRSYTSNINNATARFALYESILPLFNEMPGGLSRAAAPSSPSSTTVPSVTPTSTPSAFVPISAGTSVVPLVALFFLIALLALIIA